MPSAGQAASAPSGGPLNVGGLRIDRQKRLISIDAQVSVQQGLLEFLLCRKGTRDYESLLTTSVPPSALHAALLSLGLSPGRHAQTLNQVGHEGIFMPPDGPRLEISVQYQDAAGAEHTEPATFWMKASATGKAAGPTQWVFTGSQMLENGRYLADVEGLHITTANFPEAVVDVPFRSTDKNAFLEFVANDAAVPPPGTPVKLLIQPIPGAQTAPVARMLFEIDSLGRLGLDGQPILPDEVPTAVRAFQSSHNKAYAVVRIDPRALVYDREQLQNALEQCGVSDITFETLRLAPPVLPRTATQAARALTVWSEQFARAKDLLSDPADDAQAVLEAIGRREGELKQTATLLGQYAAELREMVDKYKAGLAASQPASGPTSAEAGR